MEFTYSVSWHPEDTPFSQRMDKLAGGGLLPETFEVCVCVCLFCVVWPRMRAGVGTARQKGKAVKRFDGLLPRMWPFPRSCASF